MRFIALHSTNWKQISFVQRVAVVKASEITLGI